MRVLFLNPPFHRDFRGMQRSPAVTRVELCIPQGWLMQPEVAIKSVTRGLGGCPGSSYSVRASSTDCSQEYRAVICDTSTPSILNDVSVIEALVAASLPCMC